VPKVGRKTFPYTKEGMIAAKEYARQQKKKGLDSKIISPVTKSGLRRIEKGK
tara:strand:- start:1309 stop:1464 length:156 start_codon:yes stop_codon:yes gene_type:complete